MPNWCSNTLYVSHPDASKIYALLRVIEEAQYIKEDAPALFHAIRPMPDEYNDAGWYEWRVENWGTKWNPYNLEVIDREPNRLCLQFLTAWSPPIPLYVYMTGEGYDVEAWYSEDGMCFRGTYTSKDGDHCEEWSPDEDRDENGDLI